jgi:hypothetical protein
VKLKCTLHEDYTCDTRINARWLKQYTTSEGRVVDQWPSCPWQSGGRGRSVLRSFVRVFRIWRKNDGHTVVGQVKIPKICTFGSSIPTGFSVVAFSSKAFCPKVESSRGCLWISNSTGCDIAVGWCNTSFYRVVVGA